LSHKKFSNFVETAPETWGDNPGYDERVDVYSFGVILWRLFGSKLQYEEEDSEWQVNGKPNPEWLIREEIRKVSYEIRATTKTITQLNTGKKKRDTQQVSSDIG
jgi:hypothetical protein